MQHFQQCVNLLSHFVITSLFGLVQRALLMQWSCSKGIFDAMVFFSWLVEVYQRSPLYESFSILKQGLFNSSPSGKSFAAWRRVGESPCDSSESHHWDVEGHWKEWLGDWRLLDHLVYSSLFFSVLTSHSNNRPGGFCLKASICWS